MSSLSKYVFLFNNRLSKEHFMDTTKVLLVDDLRFDKNIILQMMIVGSGEGRLISRENRTCRGHRNGTHIRRTRDKRSCHKDDTDEKFKKWNDT